jgi:hypothetical protein
MGSAWVANTIEMAFVTSCAAATSVEEAHKFGSIIRDVPHAAVQSGVRVRASPPAAPQRQSCPVVERQRPAAQAWIARDRIVLVDAAQDRVFHLAVTTTRLPSPLRGPPSTRSSPRMSAWRTLGS